MLDPQSMNARCILVISALTATAWVIVGLIVWGAYKLFSLVLSYGLS